MIPFFWDDRMPGVDASQEQRDLFGEASDCGIRCGLTVPIHDSQGKLATVSFTSDSKPAEIKRDIEVHKDVLHLASIYFHVHARQKLENAVSFDDPHLSPREAA